MATNERKDTTTRTLEDAVSDSALTSAEWMAFSFLAYAKIVSRKHGITVPTGDLPTLSASELEVRVRLLADLAHLPPA